MDGFPNKAKELVETLSELFRLSGDQRISELLLHATPYISLIEHDNWDGGTDTYALHLQLSSSVYANISEELKEIEKKISEKLEPIMRQFSNIYMAAVIITPLLETAEAVSDEDYIIDNDKLAQELESQKILMVSVSTGGKRIQDVNEEYIKRQKIIDSGLNERLIKNPNTYADLWAWYGKWSCGYLPTYQSRREFIGELFNPLIKQLNEISTAHDVISFKEPTRLVHVGSNIGEMSKRPEETTKKENTSEVAGKYVKEILERERNNLSSADKFIADIKPFRDDWQSFEVKLLTVLNNDNKRIIINGQVILEAQSCAPQETTVPFKIDDFFQGVTFRYPLAELEGFLKNLISGKVVVQGEEYNFVNTSLGPYGPVWVNYVYDYPAPVSMIESLSGKTAFAIDYNGDQLSTILNNTQIKWQDFYLLCRGKGYNDPDHLFKSFFGLQDAYVTNDYQTQIWIYAPVEVYIKEFRPAKNKLSVVIWAGPLIKPDNVTLRIAPSKESLPEQRPEFKLSNFSPRGNCLYQKDVQVIFDQTAFVDLTYQNRLFSKKLETTEAPEDKTITISAAKKSKIDRTHSVFQYRDKKLPSLRNKVHKLLLKILDKVSTKTKDTYISLEDVVKPCGWTMEDYKSDPEKYKNRISGVISKINKALESVGLSPIGRLDSKKGYLCPIALKDIGIVAPPSTGKGRHIKGQSDNLLKAPSSEDE